jgi:hypothetical protein
MLERNVQITNDEKFARQTPMLLQGDGWSKSENQANFAQGGDTQQSHEKRETQTTLQTLDKGYSID